MKRFFLCFLMLVLCGFSVGCSSKHMQVVTAPQETVPEGMATITFYRYSSLGGAIQAPVAEFVQNDVKFVGILSVDTKVRHVVAPGEHIYVVGGEESHQLQATVAANKHYYVRIVPKMGLWKARFDFEPISLMDVTSEKVQKELSTCEYVVVNESGKQWFISNKASMLAKAQAAQQDANAKDIMNKPVLPAAYGVDKAY